MAIIQLVIAILATYRIANLLPDDDGPFFVFKRIRIYVSHKAMNENDDLGFWAMIEDGINCAHCCGLYAAMFVSLFVLWQNYYANVFLLIFAVAGGQSLTKSLANRLEGG
jgi:hypothetical protein